jgi:hypothetical protein
MAEDNQDNKLKLSGYERPLLNSVVILNTHAFKCFLEKGANPHYAGQDGKDAFGKIQDLQLEPYHSVRRIANRMSKILLEHELKRSNNYLIGMPPVEPLPTQQLENQVQGISPRTLATIPTQERHLEKYLNEPMKRRSI